jgi:AAA+ superfamily predicted ATPase
MDNWLQRLTREIRLGSHAFIITGDIGDGFPSPQCSEPGALVPWHELVISTLTAGKPEYLGWVFDPATGYSFRKQEDTSIYERFFRGEKSGSDKKAKKKKGDDDADEMLARLEANAAELDEPIPPMFINAVGSMVRVLASSARAKEEDRRPCIAAIHDVDAVWNGTASDERTTRAFLNLLRIAENDEFRKAGHLLLIAVPSLMQLPERFRRPDSPFTVIRISRPSEADRGEFIRSIVVSEEHRARLAELRTARKLREEAAARALDADIAASETELLAIEEERGANAEISAAEQALESARAEQRRQETEAAATIARFEAEFAAADRAALSAATEFVLNGDSIRLVKPGDMLECRIADDPAQTQRQAVLKVTDGELQLSTREDLTVPVMHAEEKTPVIFYWGPQGYMQHRFKERHKCAPNRLPADSRLVIVPSARRKAVEEKERAQNLLGHARTTCAQDVEKAKAAATAANAALERLNSTVDADRQRRLGECRDRLERFRAQRTMGKLNAADPESERQEHELLAGRFPAPSCGIPVMARLTQGLGFRDIVRMLRAAQNEGKECDETTLLVARRHALKRSYGHLVEIVQPKFGFDGIAGLDQIKDFFRSACDDIKAGLLARVPMGVLLMGPPGTGKTAVAEALAEESGFLYVKIKNVRSMWVGETERQMEELVTCLRELAPVVVLRDEVDQEDTGRDSFQGDSGVSARVRKVWMEFLSDPVIRGKVLVVSCSNRPDLLDAAMLRSGRTDERIPVLMPEDETRRALFPVMIRRYAKDLPGMTVVSTLTENDIGFLAKETENLTGADIEVIVRRAIGYADHTEATVTVGREAMLRAIRGFIPSASIEQIARMTLASIKNCANREFLPKDHKAIVRRCLKDLGIDLKKAEEMQDAALVELIKKHGAAGSA